MTTLPNPHKVIEVRDVRPGSGSVIARCDLKLGGLILRNVSLRRGRNGTVHLNFPSYKNERGRWVPLVELVSPALETFVRQAVHRAVSEGVRDDL